MTSYRTVEVDTAWGRCAITFTERPDVWEVAFTHDLLRESPDALIEALGAAIRELRRQTVTDGTVSFLPGGDAA